MFQFTAWPTESRAINQYFGENRYFDYTAINKKLPGHEGIDVRASHGSKICSVAAGTVTKVGTDENHAYGLHVRVRHSDGYLTIYAHLSQIDVWEDQAVAAGQQLGLSGSTGNSTGPHLHLTLKQDGAAFQDKHGSWPYHIINPERFLLPLLGLQRPAGPYLSGWAYTAALSVHGEVAQANSAINLRVKPRIDAAKAGLVPHGTTMIVTGAPQGSGEFRYYPVQVPTVAVTKPATTPQPAPVPQPPAASGETAAWAFTTALTVNNEIAIAGKWGLNLRAAPRRDAGRVGVVAEGVEMRVTGAAQGEYTPIAVDSAEVLPATRSGKDDLSLDNITLGAIQIGIRGTQFDRTLHDLARGELVWISADDDFDQLPLAEPELSWGLQIDDAQHITSDLVQLRNKLSQQHVMAAIPSIRHLEQTRQTLIAADVVVGLPIKISDWSTLGAADGVLVSQRLAMNADDHEIALIEVEAAIAETRYQPVWVVVRGNEAAPLDQAANFLTLWGGLQQHPMVQGIVLQLSDALSANDARRIAEIIGSR